MVFTDLLKSFPQWGGLGASPHQGLVPPTKFPHKQQGNNCLLFSNNSLLLKIPQ